MSTVLEEVTSDSLTRAHVEERLKDWVQRIENLYATVESWLPVGWNGERSRTVTMHAELMREFGVPPKELPILTILRGSEAVAFFEPRDLWIIGANGRLDLHVGDAHYIIIDTAENFQVPMWAIAPLLDRSRREPFNRDKLLAILKDAPNFGN